MAQRAPNITGSGVTTETAYTANLTNGNVKGAFGVQSWGGQDRGCTKGSWSYAYYDFDASRSNKTYTGNLLRPNSIEVRHFIRY